MKIPRFASFMALISALVAPLGANVYLPSIFSDHMVLEQNSEITVWGWAGPYEQLTLTPSWVSASPVNVEVPSSGRWKATLRTPAAGGPYTLTVEGRNKLVVNDILIGEVWMAAGQSNMELSGETEWMWINELRKSGKPGTFDPEKLAQYLDATSADAARYPQIRFFRPVQSTADLPQDYVLGSWELCSPQSMIRNSLVAYFFAKNLTERMGQVPVGILQSTWGGTCAETWTPAEYDAAVPEIVALTVSRPEMKYAPYKPGKIFNCMVHPFVNYHIKGLIWCQGEENASPAKGNALYATLFSTMIKGWRANWGYDFPVYYVQIAPFRYNPDNPESCDGTVIRDEQRRALNLIDNSAMIVVSDIGDLNDIHPKYKDKVGERLASWALNKTYGLTNEIPCGPLYESMTAQGGTVRVRFTYANGGLKTSDGAAPRGFTVAGKDMVFHPATAAIEGDAVVLSCAEVRDPVAVRLAWRDTDESNLVGGTGLPASSFRTDDGPLGGK